MKLKNFMEDKQLDLNRPLLSARRYSSTVTKSDFDGQGKTANSLPQLPPLPVYRSELKSGPVRNPGTVPFLWEKSPGQPKDEGKLQGQAVEKHLVAPKLPPGRIPDAKQKLSAKISEGKTVPLQTDLILSSSQNISSSNNNEVKHDKSNDETEEIGSSDSENSNEVYEDALDTLSRTESFFLNCSVSGMSGLEGPEIKPSGIFSPDPQTRDLMMGRFLPAAKAMASETPPYATRKQTLERERPQHIKNPVSAGLSDHSFSQNRYPHHPHGYGLEESEDEVDRNESENLSAKACGVFPQFLLKGSFCLLNPVPGIKMQAQKPMSSVRRIPSKSSYLRSCSEIENQGNVGAPYEKGSICRHQATKLHKKNKEPKIEPSQISYVHSFQDHDGSSVYRHLHSKNTPACPSKASHSIPQGKTLLETQKDTRDSRVNCIDPVKKQSCNFRDLLASESEWEWNLGSPVVEKTLYVDAVHKVKSPKSKSSDIWENDLVIHAEHKKMKDMGLIDSSTQNIKQLSLEVEKSALQIKSAESFDSSSTIDPGKYSDVEIDETNCSRRDKNLINESTTILFSPKVIELREQRERKASKENKCQMETSDRDTSLALIPEPPSSTMSKPKVAAHRKTKLENRLYIRSSKDESNNDSYLQFHLALPLPKSPSESWLKRTLPTVAAKSLSSPSPLGTPKNLETPVAKAPSGDPKWETIVRTSIVQHGHLRFSEELLTPIPEAE